MLWGDSCNHFCYFIEVSVLKYYLWTIISIIKKKYIYSIRNRALSLIFKNDYNIRLNNIISIRTESKNYKRYKYLPTI